MEAEKRAGIKPKRDGEPDETSEEWADQLFEEIMRIWDIDPRELCRSHLLGEHRELHGLWNVLTRDLSGYRSHPETRRWEGKLAALYARHGALVREMEARGFSHHSPLDPELATGANRQETFIDSPDVQRKLLRAKSCPCFVEVDEGRADSRRDRVWIAALLLLSSAGCTGPELPWLSPVAFDTAAVWIHAESDSTALQVELACTEEQQTVGLSGRSDLEAGSGMLFVFDEVRPDTAGFWMWGTEVPLDIAFIDPGGEIVGIFGMEPCESLNPDRCPEYRAGVEHKAALEVNEGWLSRRGIGVGARLEPVPSCSNGGVRR